MLMLMKCCFEKITLTFTNNPLSIRKNSVPMSSRYHRNPSLASGKIGKFTGSNQGGGLEGKFTGSNQGGGLEGDVWEPWGS